jgi:hypothetical protein
MTHLPPLVRPVTHVDAAVQATALLRDLEEKGREDLGHTIAGTTAARRRAGVDPDSGLTYEQLRERQQEMKAAAMARRNATAGRI